MLEDGQTFGELLRTWRTRRRFSQLALASEVEMSQRHLSFLESGRSRPSRDMVQRLAAHLDLPLAGRNDFLRAAGYAPAHLERPLSAPELQAALDIVRQILTATEPNPALAVDGHWTLLAANGAIAPLLAGVAPALLEPPVNVLRLSLHPEGLAPRILNYREWRSHILARLARDVEQRGDRQLAALREELVAYRPPPGMAGGPVQSVSPQAIAIPLRLAGPAGPLEFIGTTTVFGTAEDITLSGVVIESFYPADAATAEALRAMAAARQAF